MANVVPQINGPLGQAYNSYLIDLAIMLSYLYICGGRLPGLYEPLIPIDKPTRYDEGAMLYLDKLEYV